MDEDLMKEYLENKATDKENELQDGEANADMQDVQDDNGQEITAYTENKKDKKHLSPKVLWISLAAFVVSAVVSYRFPGIENTLWFIVLTRLFISVPFIINALWGFDRKTAYLRAFIILQALSWFIPFAFPLKACIIIDLVILLYGALSVALYLLGICKGGKVKDAAAVVFALHFFLLFNDIRMYTYLNDGFKFWVPALIGGVIFGGLSAFFVYSGRMRLKNGTGADKVSCVFLIAFAAFAMLWMGAHHLNFALDTSEPVKCESVIVEKYKSTSGKSPQYYLIVEENGEQVKLKVLKREYEGYEVGDTLSYYYNEGAFGEPFYTK